MAKKIVLLLIGGQSNTGGEPHPGRLEYSSIEDQTIPEYLKVADQNVQHYDNAGDSFGKFTQATDERWGFVNQILYKVSQQVDALFWMKFGQGGTYLCGESPGSGSPYDKTSFKTYASAAISRMDALVGAGTYEIFILWQQGETDAKSNTCATAYESNLATWFADIRTNVLTDARIIYSKLSDNQTYNYITELQASQSNAEDDHVNNIFISDTDGIDTFDGQHYDKPGVLTLGDLFANEIISRL